MSTTTRINGTDYTLTFQDNFDDLSVFQGHGSQGIWATSFSPHLDDTRFIVTNGESQYYVDPDMADLQNPFRTGDGLLSIHADPLAPTQSVDGDGQSFTSGLITTQMSFHATYGYLEVAASAPDQRGFLSSLWLLPTDGDWTSEIDVFETLGHAPNRLNTNHWDNGTPHEHTITGTDLSDGMHVFGLEWTPDHLTWFLDGVEVRRDINVSAHDDMFLALSLAVETDWTGPTDDTTDFDDSFDIGYIRFYEDTQTDSNTPIAPDEQIDEFFVYGNGDDDETLFGTRWDDTFNGGANDDMMFGRDGDDAVDGGTGQDMLFGQKGQDVITGSAGDDKLIGGAQADRLEGGTGTDHIWGGIWGHDGASDTIVFKPGDGKDFVHDFETGIDQIDLSPLNTNWTTLAEHMHDQGWATFIDLSSISGVSGDKMFLVGIDPTHLNSDDFIFDLNA